jgi:ubiquinone biosynthesis protein COQ9
MSHEPDFTAKDWAAETESRLLSAALGRVEALGWTRRLLAAAAAEAGLSLADAELLLPEGPRDLAALLARRHDAATLTALSALDPGELKIRERIRVGVRARVEAAMVDRAAVRRWMGFLALPSNAALGLRLVWASADALWRWAGDTATDENHYTKRVLLAEILTTTLAIRLAADQTAADAHLDGRIASVMAFERWKGGLKGADLAGRFAARLGRLRYGGASA